MSGNNEMNDTFEINSALDVRSYEKVMVFSHPLDVPINPGGWIDSSSPSLNVSEIDAETVVVIMGGWRGSLAHITQQSPRLIAFIPRDEHDVITFKREMLELYPWSESWTFNNVQLSRQQWGGVVVVKSSFGLPYDRSAVVDLRPIGMA